MKAIKMFGLAALTALLAMAFISASSAMAESIDLCGHDGVPCEAIHHVHEVSVGEAKLLTSFGTTECSVLFLGDVLAGTSNPLVIHGTFTYSGCKLLGSSCTATEENGPAEIKVVKNGHETSEVTGEGLVHLVCGSTIDCSYNGTGLKGLGKGPLLSAQTPDNGEVSISEQPTTKETGGFLCPKTAKLDITTSPLWPVYITTGLSGYCVETEHSTGLYTNNTCTTLGNPEDHTYKYALVLAPAGKVAGETLCYGTLLPYGLWKDSSCSSDDVNNASLYEKSTIKTVE